MKDYKKYLSERSENDEESLDQLAAELAELQTEERTLIKKLKQIETEREEIISRRKALAGELERLTEAEKKHFKEYMDVKREWMNATDEKVFSNFNLLTNKKMFIFSHNV